MVRLKPRHQPIPWRGQRRRVGLASVPYLPIVELVVLPRVPGFAIPHQAGRVGLALACESGDWWGLNDPVRPLRYAPNALDTGSKTRLLTDPGSVHAGGLNRRRR